MKNKINIKNKKAYHNYEFIEKFICGIVLVGTEIKSISIGKVSLTDSYCYFINDELFLKGSHVDLYEHGTHYNHEPTRERKLLLTKKELKNLKKDLSVGGLTIVPTQLFINEKGLCKVEIALAKGKKTHDKRETIKKNDIQRENKRKIKM